MMKRLLLMMMCFICITVQAQTDWDEEEEYYQKEFRDNLKKAQAGDAFAMYVVGHFYKDGWGVEKNGQEAVKWWQKAARKDFKQAQEALKKIDETW